MTSDPRGEDFTFPALRLPEEVTDDALADWPQIDVREINAQAESAPESSEEPE